MTFSGGARRPAVAAFAALVAFSAFAGAVGLATGAIGLGNEVTARLPFGSALFGAMALAVIVGVPTMTVAWMAWRGAGSTDRMAIVAGALLVGWIVVQVLVIRELSFFHPTYLAVGGVFLWIGRRAVTGPSPQR